MALPAASALFWIIAALMVVVTLACVLPTLVSRRARPDAPSRLAANDVIYRSRVADLDAELAAGGLPRAEHASAGVELERQRLADAMDDGHAANLRPTPRLALALAIALPALALGLYATLGDPGALSTRTRISARDAADAAAAPALRNDLVRHLARSPRDGRGWVLLARLDFEAERYAEAGAAYEKAIAASPKVAGDPVVWCEYADALGMAQGGLLAGKPRELVMRALTLNPAHPKALEMAGSAAYEAQEYEMAARYWRQLLALLPERVRAHEELSAAIARADALAGTPGRSSPGSVGGR
jgi:cytochrome c-type biogenesis protein CcmH